MKVLFLLLLLVFFLRQRIVVLNNLNLLQFSVSPNYRDHHQDAGIWYSQDTEHSVNPSTSALALLYPYHPAHLYLNQHKCAYSLYDFVNSIMFSLGFKESNWHERPYKSSAVCIHWYVYKRSAPSGKALAPNCFSKWLHHSTFWHIY